MRSNNVLGIVLPNINDEAITELTSHRTFGSVPFGGKYRMIDFQLSNMVNSGINKVGVITTNNFHSLMDHVGSGKAWDLSKRRGGITILPPYIQGNSRYNSIIENIYAVSNFIRQSSEEYILLSECNFVCNVDYSKMLSEHIKNKADVTVMYKTGFIPENRQEPLVYKFDTDNRINEIRIMNKRDGEYNYSVGSMLVKKSALLKVVEDCVSQNKLDYKKHILQDNVDKMKIYGFKVDGYSAVISNKNEYFKANMDLMDMQVRDNLFNLERPIYTKVRDDMPSKYGLGSSVKNSLIAQGCVIEGTVENCVLSKGVHIGKGAVVSNCVIMQDTKIGANAKIEYVICDKDVVIKNDRSLIGYETYPIYVEKYSEI